MKKVTPKHCQTARISQQSTERQPLQSSTQPGWAVVTGATSGIGRHYALALARRGYAVLMTGRRRKELEAASRAIAAETGVPVEPWVVDLADAAARSTFLDRVMQCGRIDVVVANAGFGYAEPFVGGPLQSARDMIAVHVISVVELFHAVIPAMVQRRCGALVVVSSLASRLPVPGSETYVATKSYLNSFSESLAVGLKPLGITVQTLLPGFTRTDFHRYDPAFQARQPASRLVHWMKPENVVRASLRALDRKRPVCIPGIGNRILAQTFALLPRSLVQAIMRQRAH